MSFFEEYESRWSAFPESDGPINVVSEHHQHLTRHPAFEILCAEADLAGEKVLLHAGPLIGPSITEPEQRRELVLIELAGVHERIWRSIDHTAQQLLGLCP